jgi:WD40 repeat protein
LYYLGFNLLIVKTQNPDFKGFYRTDFRLVRTIVADFEIRRIYYLGKDRLFTVNVDTVKIWNVTTGELIREYECNLEGHNCFYILPDNKFVSVSYQDKTAQVWDLETFEKKTQNFQYLSSLCYFVKWLDCGQQLMIRKARLYQVVIMSLEGFDLSIVHRFEKAHEKWIVSLQALPKGLCASAS